MTKVDIEKHLPSVGNNARGLRVGLLGGSFNPAHEGHVHISLEAIKRLNLDKIWWLVSPQNPLKSTTELAPLAERIDSANKLVNKYPDIQVSDIEQHTASNLTIDTLKELKKMRPDTHFIWLMGADNMVQFDQWASWREIVSLLPIAILDREEYSKNAPNTKLATEFSELRIEEKDAKTLGQKDKNGWVFLNNPIHPQSSTNIRDKK